MDAHKEEAAQRKQVTIAPLAHALLWPVSRARAQVAALSGEREGNAREAAKAMNAARETHEELKVKELVIMDLAKKLTETGTRLRDFSKLYDMVKSDRNKYVNQIQASAQALAEMKEKIKILQNEVEILRNESVSKDKARRDRAEIARRAVARLPHTSPPRGRRSRRSASSIRTRSTRATSSAPRRTRRRRRSSRRRRRWRSWWRRWTTSTR